MKSSEKKRKKKKIPSRIISSFEKASTKKTQSLFDPPYIPKRIKYNILSPTLNEPKKKKKNSTIHITIPRRKSWSARGIDNVSIIDNRDPRGCSRQIHDGRRTICPSLSEGRVNSFPPPSWI